MRYRPYRPLSAPIDPLSAPSDTVQDNNERTTPSSNPTANRETDTLIYMYGFCAVALVGKAVALD